MKKQIYCTCKSLLITVMLLVFLLISGCGEYRKKEVSLISNSSFKVGLKITVLTGYDEKEPGKNSWSITNTFNSKDFIAEVDKNISRQTGSDSGSLKVGGSNQTRVIVSQYIKGLDPECEYSLSGWIRTEDYKATGQGVMAVGPVLQVVSEETGKVFVSEKIITDNVKNNLDWTYVSLNFTPGSSDIRIDCHYNTGTGFAWFDDIELNKLDMIVKAGESIVTDNPSTEMFQYGSINAKVYQQDAILTHKNWQYVVYYNIDRKVCVARRKLPEGEWETLTLDDYTQTVDNGHNVISMGVCPEDGTIHITFDHFVTPLNYRVSVPGLASNPEKHEWKASKFSEVRHKLGSLDLPPVGYIRFVITPQNKLQLDLRAAYPKSYLRQLYLYEYDGKTGEWEEVGMYLDNEKNTSSAYINGLDYDDNGRLHITWVWRSTSEGFNKNHDICYIYSDDFGRTWFNNAGVRVAEMGKEYIKEGRSDVEVCIIPEDTGMAAPHQFLDGEGHIHVLAEHIEYNMFGKIKTEEARSNAYYYHYWRDKSGDWHHNKIPVKVKGHGEIIFDSSSNAYAVLGNMVIAYATAKNNWQDWTVVYSKDNNRFMEDVNIDKYRLINGDGILSLLQLDRNTKKFVCLDFWLNKSGSVIE